MNKLWRNRITVACLLFLAGCGSGSTKSASSPGSLPPGAVASTSTESLPEVDHPEYVHWSQFPVGMAAVRKKEVSNEYGKVRVTTTLRLVEKTPKKVVVESQVTVERSEDSVVENPPQKFEYSATFRLPAGMKQEQFSLPSFKAMLAGDETRSACGREYQSQLFTWNEVNEAGPMAVKLWRTNDVPGRMLRQEINGRNHVSVEEVVEVVPPAENAPGA